MGFLGLAIGNAYRTLLATTIPEMVLPITSNITYNIDSCPSNEPVLSMNNTVPAGKLYDWDQFTQVNCERETKLNIFLHYSE